MSFRNRAPHVQWKCEDCGVPLRDREHPDDQRSARWDSERCPWCWKQQINAAPGNDCAGAPVYVTKGSTLGGARKVVTEKLPAFDGFCGFCGQELDQYRMCLGEHCNRRYCRTCDNETSGHQIWCEVCNKIRWQGERTLQYPKPVPNLEAWEKFGIEFTGSAEEFVRGTDQKQVARPTSAMRARRKRARASVEVGEGQTPAASGDGASGGDLRSEDSSPLGSLEC